MSGQQRTLFQTWGSKVSRSAGAPSCSSRTELPRGPGNSTAHFPAAAQEAKEAEAAEAQPESDDDVLLVAVYEAERQLSLENGGFCTSAGALWIYPTNCPVRDYQLRIARTALFCNTLVCLPTGLGKTFIAAVVMYNFYRWFPSGKVVFMAPTKPLVTQQIEACYRVMGIPQSHMAEMTGILETAVQQVITNLLIGQIELRSEDSSDILPYSHERRVEKIVVPLGDEDKKFCYSHPKLKKLEEVVVEHFKSWNAQNRSEKKCDETRVMIFSSFRDSVQEIAEMLLQHQPVIRVMTFVGHASGKSMKGFTQKEQLEVVKQFRSGGYNTLVSTCVGEEGLDIGEVDLIICFDAQKSPIRLVQRMGRTGRKRQGRIVVILAEGREERTYNQSQSNKRSIYKAISGNKQVLHFYQGSPRMVPDGINPQLHKMFITHGVFEPEKPSRNLQRKSSIFSHRNEMRQSNSKKDWFLSEEEFKLWNKRYRLRDSDGTKEITLPQVQFLSLQNENRQGECSYELEVKSYLQMEDVSSTSSVPRHEYNPFAYGTFASNKKSSFTKNINKGKSFSMTESSEECAEVFKQTRIKPTKIVSLKKKASKELKKDQPKKEKKDVVMEPLDTDSNSIVENICQVDLLNDERTLLDTDEVTATCASNENVANQSCELLTECQFTSKSTSSFTGNSDSGYNSLSDEKSLSSTLLLPFEDELYIAGIDDQFYHGHSLTSENLEFSLTAHPSEKSCIYGTTNDKISDESSFCDYDKVHKGIKNENLVSSNHMQVNIGPPKYFVEEKNHDVDNDGLPILHTDQDESLLLFDDVNTEFNDFFISDELLLDDNSEPQDQIICDTNNWKSHEDLRGVHEEKLKNDEYGFDCSKDLFSVTFDLGFCSPDSDDEVLEHAPDTNKNKFLDHLSGRCLDTKETSDANYVSDQAGHVDSSTGITITIPSSEDKRSPTFAHFPMSAAKNKEFMSPGYSQFSLPVEEKVMSTPLSESNTLNSLSKKKLEMARTSDSNKGKVNLQSSKETLHSTFDDSGLSVEKTKSREQINLRQSCHSGKDEQLTSSESEDEIFQRRIKKTKGNVLDSPEDQKNSEVDSPLHAVKKHRVPPNRLDFSSSDESENFHKRDLQSEDFKDLNRKDKKGIRVRKRQSHLKLVARKFLDDEAELSQEDAECVSSDENDESENEQDSSLLDFLNDETQLSQAINGK
ncbi:Fanconi anemia group M protein [Camelus ferus]|nr:Fanconi anemia group M protein [Camelus ferus]